MMSGEDLRDRYQLLKTLAEGEVTTYLARAANGDRVMVHLFSAAGERGRDLVDRLDGLSDPARSRVRETLHHEGRPVVVTDYLQDFESFEEWMDRVGPSRGPSSRRKGPGSVAEPSSGPRGGPGAPPPADDRPGGAAEDDDSAGSDEPGEFTRLFEQPSDGETASESAEPETAGSGPPHGERAPGPRDRPDAGENEESDEPGEFTRMFERPSRGDAAAPSGGLDPGEGPPSRSESGPRSEPEPNGGTPEDRDAHRESDGVGEAPSDEDGPGEFTRMFGSPDPSPEDDVSGLGASPGRDEPGGSGSGIGGAEDDEYLDRLASDLPGEADGRGGTGRSGPARRESRSSPSHSKGPSEYTRVIEGGGFRESRAQGPDGGAVPAGESPAGQGGSPAAGTSGSSAGGDSQAEEPKRWPWIVGLVVVLLAAAGLVIYLALQGGDSEAGEGAEEAGSGQEAASVESATPGPMASSLTGSVPGEGSLRFARRPQSSPGRTTRSSTVGEAKSDGT